MISKELSTIIAELLEDGDGDVELIIKDTDSGCTSNVKVSDGEVNVVDDNDNCDTLCDRDV